MLRGTRKAGSGIAVNPNPDVDALDVILAYDAMIYPTVCVWEPVDGIGHAAVFIRPAAGVKRSQDTTSYASWFPGDDTKTGESGAGMGHLAPGKMLTSEKCSFFEDCSSEASAQGHQDNKFRLPEHMITLRNLNMPQMQAEWNAIRNKPGSHYRLMRKNCSTIAARVIRAGMTSSQHFKLLKKSHQAWWTPWDVQRLAEELARL